MEFSEIRAEASRIVVGTVVVKRGHPEAPDAIAVRVEQLLRGESGPNLVLEPPDYMGCDGRIVVPIGTRLVIATGDRFFDAAPRNDLHPYWIVNADGSLDPEGVESADPTLRTMADLARAFGAPAREQISGSSGAEPDPSVGDRIGRGVDWTALAGLLGVAVLVIGWLGRRVRASRT